MVIHFQFSIALDFIFTNPHPTLYSHLFEIRTPEAIQSMFDESAKPFSLQCPSEISACKPQNSLVSPAICLCCRQYFLFPICEMCVLKIMRGLYGFARWPLLSFRNQTVVL